jgi:palmitoyl transferase
MLVARNDIFNGWPFPAVLPLASLRYQRFTLLGTYIPTLGGVNNGSILYVFGKIALD